MSMAEYDEYAEKGIEAMLTPLWFRPTTQPTYDSWDACYEQVLAPTLATSNSPTLEVVRNFVNSG